MTISEPMWTNSRYLNLMWGNQKSKKSEEHWEHSSSKKRKNENLKHSKYITQKGGNTHNVKKKWEIKNKKWKKYLQYL